MVDGEVTIPWRRRSGPIGDEVQCICVVGPTFMVPFNAQRLVDQGWCLFLPTTHSPLTFVHSVLASNGQYIWSHVSSGRSRFF